MREFLRPSAGGFVNAGVLENFDENAGASRVMREG